MAKPNVIVTIVSHEYRLRNLPSVNSEHSTASQLLLNHWLGGMQPEAHTGVTVCDGSKQAPRLLHIFSDTSVSSSSDSLMAMLTLLSRKEKCSWGQSVLRALNDLTHQLWRTV